MACNEFMDLARYARTPVQKQAIRELLDMNRDERLRIERNLEARAKRFAPTNSDHGRPNNQHGDFDRGDGQDAGRWAGRK